MVSAAGVLRHEGFPYALDNGAWSAFQQGRPFDVDQFVKALDLMGVGADFVVVPDSVEDREETLKMAETWLPRLDDYGHRRLLAVQDGMTGECVAPWLGPDVGIFVGGSTGWKERTMAEWGRVARRRGCWLHVGRVNTRRRLALCKFAGADSFDGSGPSKFDATRAQLNAERAQLALFHPDSIH
jgi:hypothetical protein